MLELFQEAALTIPRVQTLSTFLTALLPLLGVIVGASLQFYFSKSGERRKQLDASKESGVCGLPTFCCSNR